MPVALFTEWHAPDGLGCAQSQTYMDTRSSSTIKLANLTNLIKRATWMMFSEEGF